MRNETAETKMKGEVVMLEESEFAKEVKDLLGFAWFSGGFDARLHDLASLAQPEAWDVEAKSPLGILSNYLRYTYKRLVQEGKIVFGENPRGDQIAAFNTGLFTTNYEAIYALFDRNSVPDRQPWFFRDFIKESDSKLSWLSARPRAARYFDKPHELVYDPDKELVPNLDHIVDDNVERYPPSLRDNRHQRRMILQGAIAEAGKRAQMNYKVAVPQFYFGREGGEPGRMQLLLPLCFESPLRADLALVVQREGGAYRAFTVLPLELAYKNARLIARPEVDWLPVATRDLGEADGSTA